MPLYGRVAALQLFRPPGEPRDLLLLLTERNKFCVLAYDEEAGARCVGLHAHGRVCAHVCPSDAACPQLYCQTGRLAHWACPAAARC